MWSNPLLCRFRQSWKIPQTQALQGFAAFRLAPSRIRPRHSQIKRDTNFATPGYSFFCHDTTARGKNKDFSACGHSCGQRRFCAAFSNQGKTRYCPCRKALRRFALPCSGYRHGTPKPGAIPTSLHPDKDTPPASGRRIYYTSFFFRLQGENLSWCLLCSGGFFSPPNYSPSAAFSSSTRSVFSQATPRSSRPMWP